MSDNKSKKNIRKSNTNTFRSSVQSKNIATGRSNVIPFERASGRNTPNINTDKKRRKRSRRRRTNIIYMGAIVFFIFIVIFSIANKKNAYQVFVAEESVGIISSKNITKEYLVKTVSAQLEQERGSKVELNDELVLDKIRAKKDKLVTSDYIITKIREKITYKVEAAVITADGGDIAILNNSNEANELLDGIIMEYIPEGSNIIKADSGFVQDVKVTNRFVNSEEIITSEMALEKFTHGTISQKPYTIASGDTLYKIAVNVGMTVEEILDNNAGMTVQTPLKVGTQINITVSTPFLSVKTTENATFVEKQPKTIEYQKDDTKTSSYKKVIQQGKDGQKEVTVQIIRINGFEEEQKVISEKIIQEPINEVIVVGTK